MNREDRHHEILKLLTAKNVLSIRDICDTFDVSEMTVRRDLAQLENEGCLIRTHGGAVLYRSTTFEVPFSVKQRSLVRVKQAMAQTAATLVEEDSTIILDASTINLELARLLSGKTGLTVITNCLPIANEFLNSPGVRLFVTGGILRQTSSSLVGPQTIQTISGLNADLCFLGVEGISLDRGLSVQDFIEAQVKQTFISISHRCVVMAEHTKFGLTSLVQVAPIEAVDAVVTDSETFSDFVRALEDLDIKVLVTGPENRVKDTPAAENG